MSWVIYSLLATTLKTTQDRARTPMPMDIATQLTLHNGEHSWLIPACHGRVGCPVLNAWSNPDLRYNGVPMGDAQSADNRRVLELTKQSISKYYSQ